VELEFYHYAIAIVGGFIAAIMNTLAGYGSIITLTIMMDLLGLPANMANGTNRVNILANGVAGSLGYYKNGKLSIHKGKGILITVCTIGVYGGFIQMGMGIVFLMAAVLMSKYTIIKANALKLVLVVIYTLISIFIFHYNGLIDWKIGGVLSIGTAAGGYLTANYSSRIKNANLYAYRFLVLVVLIVIIRTFWSM